MKRLIPAYAGNTQVEGSTLFSETAHPRLRGEHFVHLYWTPAIDGSSPPTRGTRHDREARRKKHRLIPAYAGNTP